MTTRLIMLGTAGGPTPKANRSAPAQAIEIDGRVLLFDCGNGVARRMTQAGLPFTGLEGVFVTHHHSDHNADMGNVLLLGWAAGLRRPVGVYGPPPVAEQLRLFWQAQAFDIETRIVDEGRPDVRKLCTAVEVAGPGVIYERDGVRVTTTLVHHPPIDVALAFRLDTEDRSIVISGDTTPCDALVELAQGADVLVHEVLHVPALGPLLGRTNGSRLLEHLLASHTRSDEVGKVAARAGVSTLVLSHFVPGDDSVPDEVWLEAARRHYDGLIVLAQDLMVL